MSGLTMKEFVVVAFRCRRSDDQQLVVLLLCRLWSEKRPSRGGIRPQLVLHAEKLEMPQKATLLKNRQHHHRRRDDDSDSDDDSTKVFLSSFTF